MTAREMRPPGKGHLRADLRRALRSPLPHGLPARTLDKTLIIARWRPGPGFWAGADAAGLAGEILAAADLTIIDRPETAGDSHPRAADGPEWLRRLDWTPSPHTAPAATDALALWFDARRIAFAGPVGRNFFGFTVSGTGFCLVTEAGAAPAGMHPVLLGKVGASGTGFVVPEELADLAAEVTLAVRPVRRAMLILAAGRFRPALAGFGEHSWTALEIDFRDEQPDDVAGMAGPIATPAESRQNDSAIVVQPVEGLSEIRMADAPAGPPDDFLSALKALFFGR